MPKEEWGVKRLCPHCNSRFYDLQRDPMTCPECGHTFAAESLASGRGRSMISDKSASARSASHSNNNNSEDLGDDEVLDDDDNNVDLDDDLLEDDEDDNVSLDEIADVGGNDNDDDR